MIIVRVEAIGGTVKLTTVPLDRFLLVDGVPSRFIDDEGTLRSVKPFAWGKNTREIRARLRS